MERRARYLIIALVAFALTVTLTVSPSNASGKRTMTSTEATNFRAFINFWAQEDICWKRTTTRGSGFVPTECPGAEKNGSLCYPKCRAGFKGVGPVCWKNCPAGYTDTSAHCLKPQSYGRGGGYPWKFGDWLDDSGMFARCETDHGRSACEKHGLIVYPKCRAGFHSVGCCVCSPDCPAGMTDIGVSCQKQSYGRTAGFVPDCPSDHEKSGLLCYPKCPAGTTGIGPVCWGSCPPDFPVNCGGSCAKSAAACAESIINQVTSTGELLLNVGSFITGTGPAAKVALTAARNTARATGKRTLSKQARQAAIEAIKQRLREEARKEGKSLNEEALDKAALALETAKEQGEFDWTMLDPTGIAAVVDAFNKPICGQTISSVNVPINTYCFNR